jgi:lipopolysaccharide export system protein LptA
MKPLHSVYPIFICLILLMPGSVYPEQKKTTNTFNTQDGKIKIESISWELDIKKSMVTFSGDVKFEGLEVEGENITMSCQKLEVYFKNTAKDTSEKPGEYNIEKAIATESVVVKQLVSGGYATAEKAEYLMESEKIFLSGNPYFTDGKGREGRAPVRLIFDLREKSIIAEGTKEDKATLSRTGKDER